MGKKLQCIFCGMTLNNARSLHKHYLYNHKPMDSDRAFHCVGTSIEYARTNNVVDQRKNDAIPAYREITLKPIKPRS